MIFRKFKNDKYNHDSFYGVYKQLIQQLMLIAHSLLSDIVVRWTLNSHGPPVSGLTKLRSTWASTALRSPPSAADIYDQPTSISWLHVPRCRRITFGRRAFSMAGPTVWNSLPTEFCDLSCQFWWLQTQPCSRDISARSAIEMRCIILRYINFLFYYILWQRTDKC